MRHHSEVKLDWKLVCLIKHRAAVSVGGVHFLLPAFYNNFFCQIHRSAKRSQFAISVAGVKPVLFAQRKQRFKRKNSLPINRMRAGKQRF
jgi:hypothetical protein